MPELSRLEELRVLDEVGRYQLFMELYGSCAPQDRQTLADALAGADPLLKMLLLQYLDEIPEPRAVGLILDQLESDNEPLREAAIRAYSRNSYVLKHKLLRPHVLSPRAAAACFAVRTLSALGDVAILPALLARLDDAEARLKREILRALSCLPDPRSVPALERLAASAGREEIRPAGTGGTSATAGEAEEWRYGAVRALAQAKAAGCRVPLEAFMSRSHDSSDRVRRAAIEGLRHFPSRGIARLFLEQGRSSREPVENRRRAIQALINFPGPALVPELVDLMLTEPDGPLRLTAEIALKRFPAPQLKAGLLPLLEGRPAQLRQKAALLLAETMGQDPSVRRRLLGLWDEGAGLPERLAALEVLGELGGGEARDILRSQLGTYPQRAKAEPILAYTAAGILERLWRRESGPQILALLQDPALPRQAVQSLLNTLLRRGEEPGIREELFAWLVAGLRHEVTNIRYLSLRLISRYPLSRTLAHILPLLIREEDPEVAATADETVVRGLGGDPRPLVEAAARCEDPLVVKHLVRMLCRGTWARERAFDMLTGLLRPPLSLPEKDPQAFLALCVTLMENGSLTLVHGWLFTPTDALRQTLLERLRDALRDPERHFAPMPLDFLSFHLAKGDACARALLYELVGLSRQSEGVPLLAAWLFKEDAVPALETGRAALRRLIAEAQAPEPA